MKRVRFNSIRRKQQQTSGLVACNVTGVGSWDTSHPIAREEQPANQNFRSPVVRLLEHPVVIVVKPKLPVGNAKVSISPRTATMILRMLPSVLQDGW
jgi:hypothetical protein